MNDTNTSSGYTLTAKDPASLVNQHGSAVSWGAVLAGAAASAAFALILLTLGTGLGLGAISPWSSGASNSKAFGFAAVIWVCVTAVLTSGLGGYLAGRLRCRWLAADVDEIHFRDTAHGFLSWAVATLVTAAILTSAAAGIAKTGAQAAAANASASGRDTFGAMQRGGAAGAMDTGPLGYFVDSLFRMPADSPPAETAGTTGGNETPPRAETARIFLNSAATGAQLPPEDIAYLSQLVAQRTGVTPDTAHARVIAAYTNFLQKIAEHEAAAKNSADRARKVTIGASLWLFVSLLMGAFSASLMATFGGRAREA